ncbi:MAG TPA: SpoIIE family protein phosphatase, partial [Candidatus Acidoferrales bacterium]|nr:SpoIIE family protein phosphatase [Candidatus Acidoferrales bacterium]
DKKVLVEEVERPEWLGQMEAILETLNEGVMVVDDCQRVIFTNPIFREMSGFPEDMLTGQTVSDFYTVPEARVLNQHRERGLRDGHNRFEFVLPKKDGGRLPVIISARGLEDPEGRIFAVITFTDISEQKSAELKLREANAKLEDRQKQIEEELTLAAHVQQTLAPQSIVWGAVRVDAYYHPVRRIGGDFGLVAPQDDDYLNLLVFDVSGHGIGAALVANRLYTATMAQLAANAPFRDMFRHLNRFVLQNLGGSVFFFTAAAARIDRDARRLVFAGAGHPPGMIVTPGQQPRLLESRAMVLGALPEAVGGDPAVEAILEPGDRIVLYTDGITDVFDSRGEMLGVPGVQKFVRETATLPFGEMKHALLDRVAAWRDGPPSDDVSIVLAEVQ